MTRYSRPADSKNPALDLGQHEPFTLDLNDGNGSCAYAGNHLQVASPAELARLGFTAYEPPPPPPPEPEQTPLARVQLHLALYMPQADGGLGFAEAEIAAIIATLPAAAKAAARIRLAHADLFRWDHEFIQALVPAVMAAKGLTLAQIRAAWMAASAL